jgi:hypothetical protein
VIELDSQDFPILFTRWSGKPSPKDIDAFFAEVGELTRRAKRERTQLLVFAADGADLSAAVRKHVAEAHKLLPDDYRASMAGTVVVIRSSFTRGIITVMRWLLPSALPVHAAADTAGAINIGRELYRPLGLGVPPAVAERFRRFIAHGEAALSKHG